jgi:GntR family transcriptional regulator, transcriptional repressor for pyruvate dehydrogenase complex
MTGCYFCVNSPETGCSCLGFARWRKRSPGTSLRCPIGLTTLPIVPLQSIEPRRLYRQIAEQLRVLIRAGEFPVGSRMPTERDLAAQLGVSRPSVREALIALEVQGLVEVRMGSGIYVTAREAAPSARDVESALGPFEIIRARQLVEGELAAVAASCDGAGGVALALEEAVREMEADIAQGRMPIRGDRLFHARIAEASDNSALVRVVTELFDERSNPLFERLGSHFEGEHSWLAAVNEHRSVIRAIAARDPDRAREAMHEHLERSHDRFAADHPEAPRQRAEASVR